MIFRFIVGYSGLAREKKLVFDFLIHYYIVSKYTVSVRCLIFFEIHLHTYDQKTDNKGMK